VNARSRSAPRPAPSVAQTTGVVSKNDPGSPFRDLVRTGENPFPSPDDPARPRNDLVRFIENPGRLQNDACRYIDDPGISPDDRGLLANDRGFCGFVP